MKKMNLKRIFNWLYGDGLDRAMSERQPREDRETISPVYRPVSVAYVARISLIALLLFVLGGWNSQAWGADFYAKANAYAVYNGSVNRTAGGVYVSLKGNWPSSDDSYKDSDNSNNSAYKWTIWHTSEGFDVNLQAKAWDGYQFDGWYDSQSGGSKTSSNLKYVDHVEATSTKSSSPTTINRYARFSAITVSSAGTASTISFSSPGTKTSTLYFPVSNGADSNSDFYAPTISGEGWSISSWKLNTSTHKVEVVCSYTANSNTAQGDHAATVTLKTKSNNSNTGTVKANVDLSPSLTATPTSLDFGMFTVNVDSKMSKTVTLSFNVNAVSFSKTADASIAPFSAKLSDDYKTLTVYYEPTSVGTGTWEKDLVVYAKNGQSTTLTATQTIHLKGQAQSITHPEYTCDIKGEYMVDDQLDLQSLWTSTSNGTITYSIESFTPTGSNNGNVEPSIKDNRLSLNRAGTYELKLTQDAATSFFAGSDTKTVTVKKYETAFGGSAYKMMVDANQTADYSYTHTSAAQPTANSSDDFYYTIDDNVSFTNASLNNGANLVTFNPSNKQITACNAGTGKITLHQKETYKYTGATKSFDVAVYKYNSVYSGVANLPVKVEAEVASAYVLTYTKPDNAYIGSNIVAGTPLSGESTGSFYYTLSHDVTATNTENSADASIAISYNAGEKKVTGKNAGTGEVHLRQPETYKYNAGNADFTVTVTKNDPVFTWNSGNAPYYHNTQIKNVFSSTNTDFTYTIGASSDADVAYESGNTLYILTKAGTAQFTVSQPENYKWNRKSQTYNVTPANPSNHVTFTYTQAMYNDGSITTQKVSSAWDGSDQVRLGETSSAFDWDDKSIVIHFSGIPDKLSFQHKTSTTEVSNGYTALRQADWYVKQSADGVNWSNVWENKGGDNSNSTSWQTISNKQLSSTTRYIKLCYSGNFAGYFRNIQVTELKKFTPNPSSIDFGTLSVNDNCADKTFEFNYANVGHHVTLSVNDDHFTVSPTTITNIGGEKTGKTPVTVSYSTAEAHKSNGAKITITDELGNSATVNLSGETKKLDPTITWSPDEATFNVDDELTAVNANELAVTLSVADEDKAYVECDGNKATMIDAKAGTVIVTAHVTGNDIYNDKDFTKEITITDKEKQYITWDQDFSRLKTTDGTKSIVLNASSSSSLPVTYELVGDQTGLTLSQSGNTWTLTYSATECKNTTIVAKQGGDETYAPAPAVSKTLKVVDPTKVCDTDETLVNSTVTLKNTSVTYNIDIPQSMGISLSRVRGGWYIYLAGIDVEFYEGRNGTGRKLLTKSYAASDINNSLNTTINLSNYIQAKSVKVVTTSTYGYNLNSLTYSKQKYCTISSSSLSFETYPNTTTPVKTFDVSYSNYPLSVECTNPKFTFSPNSFGDCDEYSKTTVSVQYSAGPDEGTDNGYIYIKDNTGATLKTCTLSVDIHKLTQSITSTTIVQSYQTTDKVTLSAESNSGLTDFIYTATPSGIASFDGPEMTFSQSGTIAITVSQEGTNVYSPASATVQNVVVSKVTPVIVTRPIVSGVHYQDALANDQLSGGKATVTLRGVANTEVAGTFTWANAGEQVSHNAGTQTYRITFTPADGGMYNPVTFDQQIAVIRSTAQSIAMNNGTVRIAVDGLDAGNADSRLDLNTLIIDQTSDVVNSVKRDGAVSYEVISANKGQATISGSTFSATETGEYTIRATKAQTDYYEAATAEFKVTVSKRPNTLAIAGTEYEQYVDEEIAGIRSLQNSDAAIQTSSSDESIAYYDAENNKIVIPNRNAKPFSRTTVTIKIWQEATARFEASGEKTITVTVKKYPTSFSGSSYRLMVDGSQKADYSYTHTSAAQPTASSADDFYYTIDNVSFTNAALNNGANLVTFNPSDKQITACNAGTGKITLRQKETYKYTGDTTSFDVAVYKYNSTYAGVNNLTVKVDETVSSNYTLTYTKPNSSYIGTASIEAGMPTLGAESGNYYYTLSHDLTTSVTAGSLDPSVVIGYAPDARSATGKNQGVGTVHLFQKETYKYNAADKAFTVTVNKHDNAILVKGVSNYENTITTDSYDNGFVFTSNNTYYTDFPIVVTQTEGEDIATYYDTEENPKVVYSNSKLGTAKWSVSQEESYKYKAATNTFTIHVENASMGQCYMYQDNNEYTITTHITSFQGEETNGWLIPDAENAQYLYYDAKKDIAASEQFYIQYSKNGTDWTDLHQPNLSESGSYQTYGPIDVSNIDFVYLRGTAKKWATFSKYVRNIRLTRKPNLKAEGIHINTTADNQALYYGNVGAGKVRVQWSVVDGGELHIVSDNDHFTIPQPLISNTDCNSGTTEVTILYNPTTTQEEHATITVYNTNQRIEIPVTGKAEKTPQSIVWYINGEPVDLRMNSRPAVSTTDIISARTNRNHEVIFTDISDPAVMEKTANGTLVPLQEGEVTVTAHGTVDENDREYYAEVDEQLTFDVTKATIQTIVWDQTFLGLDMNGEDIELTAYAKWTDGYSIERRREVNYTVEDESVARVVDGKLDILSVGTTTITAYAPGGEEDGVTFFGATATKKIVVRDPDASCDEPIYSQNIEQAADCSWNMTSPQSRSIIFELNGEPQSCNFDYTGASQKDFFGVHHFQAGTVKVEQYLSSTNQWEEVPKSFPTYTRGSSNGQKGAYVNSGDVPLDPSATKIQVSVYDAVGYFYVNNMEVKLARYIETNMSTMEFGEHSVGTVFMNEVPLEIRYSNVAGPITIRSSKPDLFYVAEDNRTINVECGSHGSRSVNVYYHPEDVSESDEAILTISDGKMSQEVHLHASTEDLRYIFNSDETEWETNDNWQGKDAPTKGDYVVEIQTDVVLTSEVSVYSLTVAEGATLTIKDGGVLTVGAGNTLQKGVFGNIHVAKDGQLKLGTGVVTVNDFILDAALGDATQDGYSGQVENANQLSIKGNAYFDLALDPSGVCSPGWYDFTVPFPVSATSGVTRFDNATHQEKAITCEVNYAIMDFSESRRVATGYGWQKNHSIMQPGKCYTITIDDVDNVYRFKKVQGGAFNTREEEPLDYTETEQTNRGWNGLGNGTLAYANLEAGDIEKVQLYCHETNTYTAYGINDYTYVVGSAFFIQAPDESSVVEYKHNAENHTLRAPKREEKEISEFTVVLNRNDANATVVDRLYVGASEDATPDYEIGRDLTKFGNPTESKVAQLWTSAYNNLKLCDIDMQLEDNLAECNLKLYAPEKGKYILSVAEAPENAALYLTYKGKMIWVLSDSPYGLELEPGTTEDYGLMFEATPEVLTGIGNTGSEGHAVRKVIINDKIYIITPEGAMYDLTGKKAK